MRFLPPFVAMQFGQLLTHLDTTQQMIASSLKDNTALLTQVRGPLLVCCLPSQFPGLFRWQGPVPSLHCSSGRAISDNLLHQ